MNATIPNMQPGASMAYSTKRASEPVRGSAHEAVSTIRALFVHIDELEIENLRLKQRVREADRRRAEQSQHLLNLKELLINKAGVTPLASL
ncbi:MAG: hypothetical protein M5U26_07770 [Planctomycetota bacterium]|nr:hypothetical protein [Planctomycetota bacterium]